ncbi:helix-turn-helix domain-containing protein [Salinivibrio sp. IB872]|uniref:helix-turn-helix domain-containing protein n=1 Tax=Salinivibrio sp. IB872 TaxID=1766123 RepID=UPI000984534E|nr:helix-turn-helix domain-containing protein [Salinivibrio sp. IB872]OOF25734.1 hypothetical protein BZJ18_11015 [Salinivibrio sp. IB872]
MNVILELMDKAKARQKLPSDYALAKKLGVPRSNVSTWRTGRNLPEWPIIFDLVDLAGEDDQNVVFKVIEIKEKNERLNKTLASIEVRPA